jgi:hypothetical protein
METLKGNPMQAWDTLRQHLPAAGWDVTQLDGEYVLRAEQETELCPIVYLFQLVPHAEQLLFYIHPQIEFLPDMLPDILEYAARANYGMRIGNFEVHCDRHTIAFRGGLSFRNDRLTPALIDGLVIPSRQAFDEYFPGFAIVIAGIGSPKEAIKEVESNLSGNE